MSPRLILEFSHSISQIYGFNRSLRLGIIFGDTDWQISVRDSGDPELLLRLLLCRLGCLGLSNSTLCLLWRRIRRIPALVVARRVGPVVWVRFGFLISLLDSGNAICWHIAGYGSAVYLFQVSLHHFWLVHWFSTDWPFRKLLPLRPPTCLLILLSSNPDSSGCSCPHSQWGLTSDRDSESWPESFPYSTLILWKLVPLDDACNRE